MRIAVDGFPIWIGSAGIGRYTREMLRALALRGDQHNYLLADMGLVSALVAAPREPDRRTWEQELDRVRRNVPLYWKAVPYAVRRFLTRAALVRSQVDLYFGTNYFGLFHDSLKTVITIHDMNHVRHPETTFPAVYRRVVTQLRRHASMSHAIFADSDATRRDVTTFLEVPAEKVHVVYCGVDESFAPLTDPQLRDSVRRTYGLPPRFLLFVGTVEPRKNLARLIEAFELLCNDGLHDLGLVVVGARGWRTESIAQTLERSPVRDRIILTGRVADGHLAALYSMAEVFVLPSLYEGFGLPVLEAMACATPVVTSNVSSLPEVAGEAALLIDPDSAEDIAGAVRRVLTDKVLAESLRQRGFARARHFTWERAAAQAEKLFEQLVGSRSPSPPTLSH